MSPRAEYNRIVRIARRDAYRIVKTEALAALPAGWQMHFAVGWGFLVYDAQGKAVIDRHGRHPHPLWNKKIERACSLAADFCDQFGLDNTTIIGRDR